MYFYLGVEFVYALVEGVLVKRVGPFFLWTLRKVLSRTSKAGRRECRRLNDRRARKLGVGFFAHIGISVQQKRKWRSWLRSLVVRPRVPAPEMNEDPSAGDVRKGGPDTSFEPKNTELNTADHSNMKTSESNLSMLSKSSSDEGNNDVPTKVDHEPSLSKRTLSRSPPASSPQPSTSPSSASSPANSTHKRFAGEEAELGRGGKGQIHGRRRRVRTNPQLPLVRIRDADSRPPLYRALWSIRGYQKGLPGYRDLGFLWQVYLSFVAGLAWWGFWGGVCAANFSVWLWEVCTRENLGVLWMIF